MRDLDAFDPPPLRSERLLLIPWTPALLRLEATAPERFAEALDCVLLPDWPDEEEELLDAPLFADHLQVHPGVGPFRGHFWLLDVGEGPWPLVGSGGFKFPPGPEREVELGYELHPSFRGRGLATEAVRRLVAEAFGSGAVDSVVAHVEPENRASVAVLERCGFSLVGLGTEPGALLHRLRRG